MDMGRLSKRGTGRLRAKPTEIGPPRRATPQGSWPQQETGMVVPAPPRSGGGTVREVSKATSPAQRTSTKRGLKLAQHHQLRMRPGGGFKKHLRHVIPIGEASKSQQGRPHPGGGRPCRAISRPSTVSLDHHNRHKSLSVMRLCTRSLVTPSVETLMIRVRANRTLFFC